ncbi:MAG: CHAT domain-containing tetratricopeptide repeat protein [Cyanobacteriota bacterium]|nr:CHAT domain-containing tetratricopeptide repeat protein [Cyanobacteriota bacterium]
MDEKRIGQYLELIQALLNCPSGEEVQILQANPELVDAGLVEVMERVAEKMAADGNGNAGWLRQFTAKISRMLGMGTSATPQEYLQFLMQVLQATADSGGNPETVYPLLQGNLDKLDDGLTQILQAWATQTLSEVEPRQAQSIAAVLGEFGNLLQQFPLGNKASNMEMAIASYENALEVLTREAFPENWATTQNNLAAAYSDRIRGERAQNLEKAIASYENALQVRTRDAFPENWAMAQNNLGNAYLYRIRGERTDNLEKAIASYENALQVYTREAFPVNWAMTQTNLVNAYLYRIRGERTDNLEIALASYKNALQVHTCKASLVNDLTTVYSDRNWGEKTDNLEQALVVYEKAFQVSTREAFPVNWAMTQNNLVNAYSHRIRGKKSDNLEQAISACENALQVYTREAFPVNWAMTQNNLAIAYSHRIRGKKSDNLEQAISACENALQVYTREAFPVDWAMTQNNLAIAYSKRIQGKKADNLEQAISAYENALQVYTREAFPQNHAETLFNLGLTYQDTQQWQQAYDTFCTAIEIVESLREEILSEEESKKKLAEEYNRIYRNLVETCLHLNQPIRALEYAERSKTCNLVEQILLRDSDTLFPPDVAAQLAQLRDDIATAQTQIQQGKAANYTQLAQHLQELRQQRNQLQDAYLPVGSGFRFDSFGQTLDRHTAIIEWYITGDTFLAFVITPNATPIVWQSTPDDRDKLIDWANTYLHTYYTQRDTWETQLPQALQTLAPILHLDELLAHLPSSCNRLILIPHRYLHLFPLHALPIQNEKLNIKNDSIQNAGTSPTYLVDLFPNGVSYAPSCQLLQQIQTRQRPDFDHLFAIQTPTPDLYGADLGAVEAIQQLFPHSHILARENATQSALLPEGDATQTPTLSAKLQAAHNLLFFCHGYFNPNSPLDSGLQLADGNLTLADIITHLHLDNCRLVTLCACETGWVDFTNSSDEYIGLPSGFLIAGSRGVLSPLWIVQALPTALLVTRVYQNLSQNLDAGQSLAVALQQAQSWLRNATKTDLEAWGNQTLPTANYRKQLRMVLWKYQPDSQPFASPYYWGAFCAVGE